MKGLIFTYTFPNGGPTLSVLAEELLAQSEILNVVSFYSVMYGKPTITELVRPNPPAAQARAAAA